MQAKPASCGRTSAPACDGPDGLEGLIPGLRDGTFDAIVSSISITAKRRQLVAFTDHYCSGNYPPD